MKEVCKEKDCEGELKKITSFTKHEHDYVGHYEKHVEIYQCIKCKSICVKS